MPGRVIARAWRDRQQESERGAIAIIVALASTILLVIAGMVADFGLMRVDRQVHKSAADAAVTAGMYGLDQGDSDPHPYAGVCAAARFLKRNDPRFAGVDPDGGGWTDGNGTTTTSGCTTASLRTKACVATNKSTWAKFSWAGTVDGDPISIEIESGYLLPGSGMPEETLAASIADSDDGAGGCNQLSLKITHSRGPGLGSLATNSDMTTAVRTVGRVKAAPGGYAPALLLLKQSGCSVLQAGSASGGYIRVKGALSTTPGMSQPGSIHSDSDGTGCGSNDAVFRGEKLNGIVAYAAPLETTPTLPDTSKPGQITAYAASLGAGDNLLRDGADRVCGSTALAEPLGCPGSAVTGRGRVFRKPVDERYLAAARNVVTAANAANTARTSWTKQANASNITLTGQTCKPTQAEIDALLLTAASDVHFDCPNFSNPAALTIPAGQIYFAGTVSPSAALSMPNARKVYVHGSGSTGISLSNGGQFSVNGDNQDASGKCSTATTGSSNKAVLVVRSGTISESNGGVLELCYTTVVMMGGNTAACMPTAPSTAAPNNTTPCGGGTGTGQLDMTGGDVDWTAPNTLDVTLDADGNPLATALAAWADANGPEDLAFWSESAGQSNNPQMRMTGAGSLHLVGVLMMPNAMPFVISGQGTQVLRNAQYIAGSINLNSANTIIEMAVDPNAGVTLPKLDVVGLVR